MGSDRQLSFDDERRSISNESARSARGFRRYSRQSTASASLDLALGLCMDFSDKRYFTVLSSSAPSRRGASIEHWIDFPDKVVKTGDSYRHGWYPIFTVLPFPVEVTAQIASKEHSWIPTAYQPSSFARHDSKRAHCNRAHAHIDSEHTICFEMNDRSTPISKAATTKFYRYT